MKKITMIYIMYIVLLYLVCDHIAAKILVPPVGSTIDNNYHHTLKKNFNKNTSWGDLRYNLKTNSLGLKDSCSRKVEKDNDKYRLMFIGDSFIEGLGYSYDKTMVGVISQHIDSGKYEILNAATISLSPKLYYLKLKYLIETIGLKIDELVVFVDISDIQDDVVYQNFTPGQFTWRDFLTLSLKNNFYSFYAYWIKTQHDHTISMVQYNGNIQMLRQYAATGFSYGYWYERDKWMIDPVAREKWATQGIPLTQNNMQKLYDLCKKNNIKMSVGVYPWPNYANEKYADCEHIQIWRNFCTKNNIPFINLFPSFTLRHNEKLFIDNDVHWNENGNLLAAQEFLKSRPDLANQVLCR